MQDKTLTLEAQINNPLLAEWTGPFGVPPFERIVPEYFAPAFAHAFAAHEAEIAAIAGNARANRQRCNFTGAPSGGNLCTSF